MHLQTGQERLGNGVVKPNGSTAATDLATRKGYTCDELASIRKTDYARWRLLDERGRQTWHYLESEEEVEAWPQTTADKYHLGLSTVPLLRSSGFIPPNAI